MMPRIVQADGQIGFHWTTPEGAASTLPDLVIDDDEPDRLLATHLEALDDALIMAAARFGDLLGGGKYQDADERDDLIILHRCLDLLVRDYALAAEISGIVPDLRAGKIIGTATLFSIRARFRSACWGRHRSTVTSTNRARESSGDSARWTRSIQINRGRAGAGFSNQRAENAIR
jgi:hypothetical protein